MRKQVVIYSHGFGVRKDARGIFTAIADALPDAVNILFDYNEIDAVKNQVTVPAISVQVAELQRQIDTAKHAHPDAELILVGHSFGCVIAGLADLHGIQKIILLTPPINLDDSAKRFRRLVWPRLRINWRGIMTLHRRDGVKVVITPEYRQGRKGVKPIELYNKLSRQAQVTVIGATKDKLINKKSFSELSPEIHRMWVEGDHNFKQTRQQLVDAVTHILQH